MTKLGDKAVEKPVDHAAKALSEGQASRLYVSALARGISILSAFGTGRSSMNMQELVTATGLSRSAIQRFVHTLTTEGYLRRDERSKRYMPTVKSLAIGLKYLQGNALIDRANPYLHTLSRTCGESTSLSERDDINVVYLARFPGPQELYLYLPPGSRLPMYCTASGRAILSASPQADTERVIAQSDLRSYTSTTITDPARLREIVEEARQMGFAWGNGEYFHGDINVSAPILGENGEAIGAINIAAPSSRWTIEDAKRQLGPLVLETARAINADRGVGR